LVSWRYAHAEAIIGLESQSGSRRQEIKVSEKEDQNKQTVVRLFEEVVNQGRLEVLDEIAWPDHFEHRVLPGQTQGREGLKQRASMVRAAFNPHFTLDHVLADGDKVAVMWTSLGTHVAEWFGIAATGKSVVTHGVDIFLLRDGRLAEHWDVVDVNDFLVKTGALRAPSAAQAGGR
jgi:predicted SnoaL-like aldol condensation-catalyzing enzyme